LRRASGNITSPYEMDPMNRLLLVAVFCAATMQGQNPAVTEILNNYGLSNPGTVAQGAIFIVKGTSLADQETTTLQSVPLQSNLRNVQIRIIVGGTTTFAPLYYALRTQLAGILPSNTPAGTGTLAVINNGKTSSTRQITVVRSAFGLLTINGSGSGAAAVHDQNYALLQNANATNPGKAVILYGSGLGPTTGNESVEQSGSNASGDLTSIPISVQIGSKPAQVLYRGRTIFPGLDQINVLIPTLDPSAYGCNVALVVTTNGVAANVGTIPVAAEGSTCPANTSGGGNSGVMTTQNEVNRWIAAGSYTAGGVGLGRSTAYSIDDFSGGATTVIKQDFFTASFTRIGGADLGRMLRGELPASYSQYLPVVGSCIVYNTIPPDPWPQITRTALDAGPAIVSSGPSGTAIAERNNQQVEGLTYAARNLSNTYVNAGQYSFTGSGGPDAGAFTGSLEVYPDLVVLNNPDEFKTINRANSLTVRWNGGDPQTNVQIQGFSYSVTNLGAPIGTPTVFLCLAPNTAGQFTVPASVFGQLPLSGSFTSSGLTFLVRGSIAVAQSSRGNRVSIPNIDYGTAANSWSWAYQPRYQ
jgi:uncharacterized protein (TIGR03437 family)